jgi:ArsR family transcriptional regulator, arsenate/arsenite/antimonite-responsive transcriptional repressor
MIVETQVISAMDALAQETRLKIVKFLVPLGVEGAAAGKIGQALEIPSSRLSFHLSTLEHAGIVISKRVSRNILYRIDYAHLGGVIGYLLEDCCGNHPDIRACCMNSGC